MHTESPRGGTVRAARRPPGWVAPGPRPQPPQDPEALWPGPNEDLCWLAGDFRILQRQDGHRFSLDDVTTADYAASLCEGHAPARTLDLGCGIGSVLLFTAWRFPTAHCVGAEAQPLSADLAERSIAWNGIGHRVRVRRGDFRDHHTLRDEGTFPLITGTPPYFPIGTGVQSDRVQKAPCRFEHRGGIEAYCATAARHLAAGGLFVACEAYGQRARVAGAATAAGLSLHRWRDVVPRAGKAPLFSLFAMRAESGPCVTDAPLVVRDETGRRTADFQALRDRMGMP